MRVLILTQLKEPTQIYLSNSFSKLGGISIHITLYYRQQELKNELNSINSPLLKSLLQPIKFTTSALCSGAKCAYRSVMSNELCPSNSRTVFKSAPAITNLLAKWCRRSCHLKSLILAALRMAFQPLRTLFIRAPDCVANT